MLPDWHSELASPIGDPARVTPVHRSLTPAGGSALTVRPLPAHAIGAAIGHPDEDRRA